MGSDYRLGSVTKLLQQMQLFLIQALPRCVATVAAARARLVTSIRLGPRLCPLVI
jgi:hypothetical protein